MTERRKTAEFSGGRRIATEDRRLDSVQNDIDRMIYDACFRLANFVNPLPITVRSLAERLVHDIKALQPPQPIVPEKCCLKQIGKECPYCDYLPAVQEESGRPVSTGQATVCLPALPAEIHIQTLSQNGEDAK